MGQPTPYNPTTDFSQEETQGVAGRSTVRTAAVDVELANIATTFSQTLANLAIIQRDDGGLRDGIVEPWTMSAATLALLGSAGFNLRGNWVTATAYAARDMVRSGAGTYVCIEAHTSGVFATDYAALKWAVLFDATTLSAAGIAFTPVGTIAAANVQAAIAEAASEAVQKAANGGDFANIPTTRTNLSIFSKAEVQSLSGSFAVAGGTADAITADFTPDFANWAAVTLVVVECSGASTLAAPTLNVDGLGAKTICDPSGAVLAVGAIPGANFRALFAYDASLDKVLLLNPYGAAAAAAGSVGAAALAASALGPFVGMINGTIVATRGSSAETVAIKTKAGADPSAADPVLLVFRNATAGTGDYTVITVTAALSLTLSSGSTMGGTNNVQFRLWLGVFNDAGTARLGLVNCLSGTSIMNLRDDTLQSATAEGGAGAADSAQVIYANAAVATKAWRTLGYLEYTLAAVGTWGTAPTKIQPFAPGMAQPNDTVQTRVGVELTVINCASSAIPLDDTPPQNGSEGTTVVTAAIVPSSKSNVLDMRVNGFMGAAEFCVGYFAQDAVLNALNVAFSAYRSGSTGGSAFAGFFRMVAGTIVSTTIKWNMGANTGAIYINADVSGNRRWGATGQCLLVVEEKMA